MITTLEGKKAGLKNLSNEDQTFKTSIANSALVNIQTSYGFFIWNNKRGGAHQIAKDLDRFLVFDQILTLGGLLDASVLPMASSNH